MSLHPTFGEHTINQFCLLLKNRQVNLEPGFQRKSVWTENDRRRLIQSVAAGYPLPSIFLYQRSVNGKLVYDVIDGKQRLETIFMFTRAGRFKRDAFDVKLDVGDGWDWYDWQTLCKYHPDRRAAIESYKLQTVEVTGDLSQIIDLFVRINSTGKRLTSGEKRHAKFYTSQFLKEAERLVGRFQTYLRNERILSPAQIDRMKGTELFAELLMSIHNGGPLNKKTALDRAIGNDSINGNTLHKLSREFVRTINLVKRMFLSLKETRFHNTAEFYTLFLLVWEMDRDGFVLADKKRNRIALEMIRRLSTGVDKLRERLRRADPGKSVDRLFQQYLLTVQGDTDSSATRERRREILKNLLFSLFERKDSNRIFTPEQRRIIWSNEDKQVCVKCKKPLTWEDFSVDHVLAFAKGGKTSLKNAQPMHKRCNSSKGAR